MTGMAGQQQTRIEPAAIEVQKPQRRTYTAEYKRRIVEEITGAPRGVLAQILRREGLYSTTVDNWRKELSGAFAPRKRGRKPAAETSSNKENARLRRENERLKRKLEHATLIIAAQKKVARMLDEMAEANDAPA